MSSLILFLSFFIDTSSAQEIDYPETVSAKIVISKIRNLQDVENYSASGKVSAGMSFHHSKAEIEVYGVDSEFKESLNRNIHLSFSSAKESDILEVCKKYGFNVLQSGGVVTVSVKEIPFHGLYNLPQDMSDSRRLAVEANKLRRNANREMTIAESNFQQIQAQIIVARKVLASTKDSKARQNQERQISQLEARANGILSNAKKSFEKDMNRVNDLQARSKQLADKVEAHLKSLLEKREDVLAQIDKLSRRIEEQTAKKQIAQAEKLRIQLLIVEDRLQKIEADIAQARPGLRGHIGLNLDRLAVSCE